MDTNLENYVFHFVKRNNNKKLREANVFSFFFFDVSLVFLKGKQRKGIYF